MAHSDDLAIVGAAARQSHRDGAAQAVGLCDRRQAIGLAGNSCKPVRGAANAATQRKLNPLWHRREVGLTVERGEHGTAHERRAAKASQNCSGKPLHGDAAPIDWATRLAIDRQWRLITEVKRLDPQPRPICATSPAVIHVPSHTRPQWKLPPTTTRRQTQPTSGPDRTK